MTTLSDTQAILLSTASQRESGSILPLPACLKPGGGTTKAVDALLTRGLAEEHETSDASVARRVDGDLRFGVFITDAGLAAIGVAEPDGGAGSGADSAAVKETSVAAAAAKASSKAALVLDLLRRPAGATLPELIEATGWLPHTTRAALTGIRKKGHEVERSKRDERDLLPHRGGRLMDVEAQLAELETPVVRELRERWRTLVSGAGPAGLVPAMLRLALAWEIQARAMGGLNRAATATLDQLERGLTSTAPAAPGMRLVREWGGKVHVVLVGEDQVIRWDGREWRSLSEVARAITGTRWSGPAFFGLKKKVAA